MNVIGGLEPWELRGRRNFYSEIKNNYKILEKVLHLGEIRVIIRE